MAVNPSEAPSGQTHDAGTRRRPRVAVLISGRGSNLRALVGYFPSAAAPHWRVISNEPQAAGLAWAQAQGIATESVCHRDFPSRAAFDAALLARLQAFNPDLVVLAGFMRILTPDFCQALAGRLINIHPALLPAFTGLDTHARALAAGVRLHGATVHAVTAELDHGPILAQGVVPVLRDDTPERLGQRVLEIEHRLYPQAVAAVLSGAMVWQAEPGRWVQAIRAGEEDDLSRRFVPLLVHPSLCGRAVTDLPSL